MNPVVDGEVDLVPHRDVHTERQSVRLVLVPVRSEVHLNGASAGHVVLEGLGEAESIALAGLSEGLVVLAVVDVVVSLPRQQHLVEVLDPVRRPVGVPVLQSELSVGLAHRLEVLLDALQAVLVCRVGQDCHVDVVVELDLEVAVVARGLVVLGQNPVEADVVGVAVVPRVVRAGPVCLGPRMRLEVERPVVAVLLVDRLARVEVDHPHRDLVLARDDAVQQRHSKAVSGCVIDWVDALVGDVGDALEHVGLQQRDVRAGDAEDD